MADSFRRDGRAKDRVFDLVGAYGPDLASLCRAGPALIAETAGIGVSAGAVPGHVPQTRFCSDPASARLEAAQLAFDEGPCRDAAIGGTVRAADLDDPIWRRRWPRFTPAALDAGVRSVCALPLHAGGVHHDGAVDLYRRAPGEWEDTEQSAAATFAAAAAELLTLERLGLNLTDAFTAARRGSGDAAGMPVDTPPGPDSDVFVAGPLAHWFEYTTLATVRAQVHRFAAAHGLQDVELYRFVLAVSEAMTNAVRHGGGHGQLVLWQRADRLWCEVSDHGPGIAATARKPTGERDALGARHGRWLIDQVCASVDITTDATGTRLLLGYPLTPTAGRHPGHRP